MGNVGSTGSPGPTAGATDTGGVAPSATPQSDFSTSATVTTTTSSKLLVSGWLKASVFCTAAGPCSDTWGLYVDGAPVSGTAHTLSAGTSATASDFVLVSGMTGTLAAGTHNAVLQDGASGDFGGLAVNYPRVTAIALGG
jgi:hypothetical protein